MFPKPRLVTLTCRVQSTTHMNFPFSQLILSCWLISPHISRYFVVQSAVDLIPGMFFPVSRSARFQSGRGTMCLTHQNTGGTMFLTQHTGHQHTVHQNRGYNVPKRKKYTTAHGHAREHSTQYNMSKLHTEHRGWMCRTHQREGTPALTLVQFPISVLSKHGRMGNCL